MVICDLNTDFTSQTKIIKATAKIIIAIAFIIIMLFLFCYVMFPLLFFGYCFWVFMYPNWALGILLGLLLSLIITIGIIDGDFPELKSTVSRVCTLVIGLAFVSLITYIMISVDPSDALWGAHSNHINSQAVLNQLIGKQ